MDKNRRNFLKGAAAAGGAATFAAGYYGPLEKMGKGLVNGTSGKATADRLHGNSLAPEYSVNPQTGEVVLNPDRAYRIYCLLWLYHQMWRTGAYLIRVKTGCCGYLATPIIHCPRTSIWMRTRLCWKPFNA